MKKLGSPLAFALLMGLACARADAQPPRLDDVRTVGAFRGIDIQGTLVVEARIDRTPRVVVRGDADLVKLVTTRVENGVLVLDTPDDFPKRLGRKNGNLEVVVSAPALATLTISGTGKLDVTGLAGDALAVNVPGTGALRLAGQVQRLQLSVPGTAELEARGLVASTVALDVAGTANLVVHARKALDASVVGTAVVRVHGKPASVKKQVRGTAVFDVK